MAHYNNAVRMFKIVFEAFMRAKIDCFIEWIQASSEDNYLVNFLESKNFQNLLSKQDNESLKQCVATIIPSLILRMNMMKCSRIP